MRHAILFALIWGCDAAPDEAPTDGGGLSDVFTFDARPTDGGPARDGPPPLPDATPLPDAAPPVEGCDFHTPLDNPPPPRRHTPRWAFLPWISKDISDGADTRAFVRGFRDRDVPVGVVVLDSPWETQYNTFIPNPDRYPDFAGMVQALRAEGVRTVLWITQMVNEASVDLERGGDIYPGPSPNLAEGRRCGFFVNDGAVYQWWKGRGAGVDFFDPHARGWWHRQQDALLELGVAGWKLDFGESYIKTEVVETEVGPVPHQAYSEAYYQDFLAYGAQQVGVEEFVTMVRPWDASYEHAGRFFARVEDAPVAWVGDNRRDWEGLVDALDHMFRSAQAGYVVVGSDVGGYLDRDDQALAVEVPYIRETFLRWVGLGALTPFMQLHGRANLTPWSLPDGGEEESTRIYRYWAWLHTALVPFWYSLAEGAYAGAAPIMRPIGEGPAQWADDWRYLIGDALLVAPIFAPGGARDVALPEGERWYDWWDPAAPALDGGRTLAGYDVADPQRVPLFVREGAIIPAEVSNAVNGLGDASSAGHLTLLLWPGRPSTFNLYDEDDRVTRIGLASPGADVQIEVSRLLRPTLLRVRALSVDAVLLNGEALPRAEAWPPAGAGWRHDPATRSAWVRLPAQEAPAQVVIRP